MRAKGQGRYPFNSNRAFRKDGIYTNHTYNRSPMYVYNATRYFHADTVSGLHEGWQDYNAGSFLAHMFEQFSPYDLNDESDVTDIYRRLVNMESYSVAHDCVSVPNATPAATPAGGHHFRMYGDSIDVAKCQDVRDLMFFVPDYRMMYFAKQTVTNERSVYVADGSDGSTTATSAYIPVYENNSNPGTKCIQKETIFIKFL